MSNRRNYEKDEDSPGYGRKRGQGKGYGRRRRGRGRPPVAFSVDVKREISQDQGIVTLSSFELQILKYSDVEGFNQKEIAEKLNISQTSVWRYLRMIRERLARAVLAHHHIIIQVVE